MEPPFKRLGCDNCLSTAHPKGPCIYLGRDVWLCFCIGFDGAFFQKKCKLRRKIRNMDAMLTYELSHSNVFRNNHKFHGWWWHRMPNNNKQAIETIRPWCPGFQACLRHSGGALTTRILIPLELIPKTWFHVIWPENMDAPFKSSNQMNYSGVHISIWFGIRTAGISTHM